MLMSENIDLVHTRKILNTLLNKYKGEWESSVAADALNTIEALERKLTNKCPRGEADD